MFLQFQDGVTLPGAYAFALVEYRDGRDKLKLRTFLAGEVKQTNTEELESSPRLLKMLSILKSTNSFLCILKVWVLLLTIIMFLKFYCLGIGVMP